MSENNIELKWKRPESSDYPKVWHRFMARDVDSDELIEYRIEDLVESRVEDACKHMRDFYFPDEPVSEVLGAYKDSQHIEDFEYVFRLAIAQKTVIACYKNDSDDIVGLNILFVNSKEDNFFEKLLKHNKSPMTRAVLEATVLLYSNFNVFEHHGVNEFLASFGLAVDKKYRGREIGDHLLATRKLLCKEFGLKLSHGTFSSDYSNRNAEKAGFKTDVQLRFDELVKLHPEFGLSNIKSTLLAAKTLIC